MAFTKKNWSAPKRRSLTASSDLRLFYEAIAFIDKYELVSKKQIKQELSIRVKGLKLIKNLSDTGIEDLLRELKAFNWIVAERPGIIERSEQGKYRLTNEGKQALLIYKSDSRRFLSILITKMHNQYTIPGWFINRLWKLNPTGQGQIIIPAPIKDWNPVSITWDEKMWTAELKCQVEKSYEEIRRLSPNSFNIELEYWLVSVQEAWERLSTIKKRKDNKSQKFAPRNRLTLAMKEAAVKILFGNKLPNSDVKDFNQNKNPLSTRTYMAWCPRLEELELIYYSDYNPAIPGRIIVPTCVFKSEVSANNNYEFIRDVKNLEGNILALHRPIWNDFRKDFMSTLYKVYHQRFLKSKSLYVSIQNVRDEVCRLLRMSSSGFEDFLSKLLRETVDGTVTALTISLETDVIEEQRKGSQLERRPVRVNGRFTSLIAITKQTKNN
jgi:hypothetical protein